ncbi:MAG: hypothetical protein AAB861_00425 [Patescibacteria group bacterium]
MKDQETFESLSKKLSALLALYFVKEPEKMTSEQGVKLLMRFGLSNQEMADILGTTKGTIEVLKSRVSKSKK